MSTTSPITVTSSSKSEKVLTRIYIKPDGDLVVTDMWDEVRALLEKYFPEAAHEADENL